MLEPELAASGVEDGESGDHGGEDAREQRRDFQDGAPGEAVLAAQTLGGGPQGERRHGQHARVLEQRVQAQGAGRQQHRRYASQIEQVPLPGDAQRHLVLDRDPIQVAGPGKVLLAEDRRVHDVEEDEQDAVDEHPFPPEPQRPGEGNAAEESEEERRVAHRRQQAAAVRDHEDEEDEDVRLPQADGVGAQQRPDEQHRRARRPDHRGEHGSDGDQHGVEAGSAGERAPDDDPSGDDEERSEQDDEGHVLAGSMRHRRGVESGRPDRHRYAEQGAEDRFVDVGLPELPGRQRENGDAEEHGSEGDDAPERKQVTQQRSVWDRRHESVHWANLRGAFAAVHDPFAERRDRPHPRSWTLGPASQQLQRFSY